MRTGLKIFFICLLSAAASYFVYTVVDSVGCRLDLCDAPDYIYDPSTICSPFDPTPLNSFCSSGEILRILMPLVLISIYFGITGACLIRLRSKVIGLKRRMLLPWITSAIFSIWLTSETGTGPANELIVLGVLLFFVFLTGGGLMTYYLGQAKGGRG